MSSVNKELYRVRMLKTLPGQDRNERGEACPVKFFKRGEEYQIGLLLRDAFRALNAIESIPEEAEPGMTKIEFQAKIETKSKRGRKWQSK
jgi:hypothetical protein